MPRIVIMKYKCMRMNFFIMYIPYYGFHLQEVIIKQRAVQSAKSASTHILQEYFLKRDTVWYYIFQTFCYNVSKTHFKTNNKQPY